MRRSPLLVIIPVILISGCASDGVPLTAYNKANLTGKAEPELMNALETDFQNALAFCDKQMVNLRDQFVGSSNTELSLAGIGIIAGSVIVPSLAAKTGAAKSAIAAWGGVSGAANAAQYSLNLKGASASGIGTVYETTRGEIKSNAESYATASDIDGKATAITKISIACRYPPLPNVTPATPPASGT
jgi:hypothetical protein